jgi:N-hydroxyarylamine O-acetyltransferase
MNVNPMYEKYLSILEVDPTLITIDLNSLTHLQFQHLKHIPFQNLDGIKKLGSLIDFSDPMSLLQPVLKKEGGICYNLNYSFYLLLKHLGFSCHVISCYISETEFDHMALVVNLDIPYLVDVGFGEYFLTAPLPITGGLHQERSGWYRARKEDDQYFIERRCYKRDRWIFKYRFSMESRRLEEFETRFQSHVEEDISFRSNVMFSRWNEQDCFVRLYNQFVTLYDGQEKKRAKIQLKNGELS